MSRQMPQPATRPLIDGLVHDIEAGNVKIPQFQRDFVWSRAKSARLIDSLLRGFPIGTFILWKTKEQLRTVRNVGDVDLPKTPEGEFTQYVLDGQQRLTSIFAAITGATVRREQKNDDFSAIYIDLAADEDDDLVVASIEGREEGTYISVRDLVSFKLTELAKYPEEYHPKIELYLNSIKTYNCSTVEVSEASIDIATEIFTRINVTGVPLTVFEIMVAKTFDPVSEFDLLQKVGELKQKLDGVGYGTVREIVVLQVVSAIMVKDTRKKSILALDKRQFIEMWPEAVDGIHRAVDYLKSFGVPVSELLPYQSMLVPLAYFFVKRRRPSAMMGKRLQDWFWRTSLAGHYSQALDTKLSQDIRRMDDILKNRLPRYDYSVDPTKRLVQENGEFRTGRAFIKAILCLLASRQPRRFDDHSLVRVSNDYLSRSNSKNYHHFFPRKVLEDEGVDEFRANHIVNVTIVDEYLNKGQIRARKPSDYMKEFKKVNSKIERTMRSHLISLGEGDGIWDDDYDVFFEHRSKWISRELKKRIIRRDLDRRGQSANMDDFESTEIPD